MSGIVGIAHLDGAPIDDDQLRRMTESLAFRGPDARQTSIRGSAGFGHTWLRTAPAPAPERQPVTLDDGVWIVADARLDARAELLERLAAAEGGRVPEPVTDVELVARAYRAWGEACLDHLLGDFAFAAWDQRARRLFLARDHLGVKPLYYARLGSEVVFSNTLACIRRHPRVSSRLNDLAIADFLMFGLNLDLATTSFADVQRLPAAHRATFCAAGARVQRYWRLPVGDPIRYRRPGEYGDHFRALLGDAIRDRLPAGPVGLFLSGGLDSGTMAASTCDVLRRGGPSAGAAAFTAIWNGFDQDEGHYAGLTAAFLRIPIAYHDRGPEIADQDSLLDRGTPEPLGNPASKHSRYCRELAAQARVFFYGEGPDNLLRFEWRAYIAYMLRRREPAQLAIDFVSQALQDRGAGWIAPLSRRLRRARDEAGTDGFPTWFNPGLERRLGLRDRWLAHQTLPTRPEAMRPGAHATFDSPLWDAMFQGWDCEATTAPFEVRYPFLDLRLVRYLLAVPTVPWCRSKALLRRAMKGRLPEAVLRREKAALAADPFRHAAEQGHIGPLDPAPQLDLYVNSRSVPKVGHNVPGSGTDLRPHMLNYWLRRTYSMAFQEGTG